MQKLVAVSCRTIVVLVCLIFTGTLAANEPALNTFDEPLSGSSPARKPAFKAIAFYTGRNDLAHKSFVKEANKWFSDAARKNNFVYDTTSDWSRMNSSTLKNYQVVIFLDTRPDDTAQRAAFENYMKSGGGWMGFHFAAFALTPSAFPQNWDWYHEEFLGSGQYVSNTWRPTSAVLRVENKTHLSVKNIPGLFSSSPNEWYRWQKDLRSNPDIDILLSIDSTSFPLGTGPKKHEIWHEGYYPVAWCNRNYHMIYFNMGHNDIDYENRTNKELSQTFLNAVQNQLILNSLLYLGKSRKKKLPVK
ncbi:MAG: ThuA domain-containing protein [Chitinophagaceae bacterium]|nr:MAG: ThuA domain-containing protein [Chitinophagaceae bacterium]